MFRLPGRSPAPANAAAAGAVQAEGAEVTTIEGLGGPDGALSPVHVSLEQNHAVYIEPNLWIHHRLSP